MSFQWSVIAGLLYFEIGLLFVLVLPIIHPQKWQRVFRSELIQRVCTYSSMYFYFIIAVLTLFLVDAVREMRKYSHPSDSGNYASEMKTSVKLFRAQRNFYITFFSLFLCYILKRLITIIDIQASLLSKSEAIIKEAEEAKDLACKTVRDHENFITLEKKQQETFVKDLQNQITKMIEKCELENAKRITLDEELKKVRSELYQLKKIPDVIEK